MSNHVHLVVHVDRAEAVSGLMHLAAGAMAKQYNLRKGHLGSLWEHPYQCTVIEEGQHLLNCLCYIDLNMVRAGVVSHPQEWRWCGYDELAGDRQRYRLVNEDRLLESMGIGTRQKFRKRSRRFSSVTYLQATNWVKNSVLLWPYARFSPALLACKSSVNLPVSTYAKGFRLFREGLDASRL